MVQFVTLHSDAAEIDCRKTRGPGEYSAERRARLLEAFPSGRLPNISTCLSVLIKRTIASGDSAKFAQLVNSSHPFLENVDLWSSGGSVEDAMQIGRLIRKGLIDTTAPTDFSHSAKGWGRLFDANTKITRRDQHNKQPMILIGATG